MKVVWFNGRSMVGIVQTIDPYDNAVRYYIGSPPFAEYHPNSENEDIQWIADWGARFPAELGDILFGVDNGR